MPRSKLLSMEKIINIHTDIELDDWTTGIEALNQIALAMENSRLYKCNQSGPEDCENLKQRAQITFVGRAHDQCLFDIESTKVATIRLDPSSGKQPLYLKISGLWPDPLSIGHMNQPGYANALIQHLNKEIYEARKDIITDESLNHFARFLDIQRDANTPGITFRPASPFEDTNARGYSPASYGYGEETWQNLLNLEGRKQARLMFGQAVGVYAHKEDQSRQIKRKWFLRKPRGLSSNASLTAVEILSMVSKSKGHGLVYPYVSPIFKPGENLE